MSDREITSGIDKTAGRNKSADKKREIYRMNTSANSVIMSTHL